MRRAVAAIIAIVVALAPAIRADDDAPDFGPGMEAPKLLTSIAPQYPAAALDEGVEGTVVVRALIDRKGRVKKTEIVSSPDKRLSKAAAGAMVMRRYDPATRGGEPIAVWWTESFEFTDNSEEAARILACDPAKVDAADAPTATDYEVPVILHKAEPRPPNKTSLRREPGTVVLDCKIDVCGRVGDCKVLKSNGAAFSESAIAAAEKRLYRPAMKNGKPLAIRFTIRVDYR